jgi:dTDP-4-dehydrorhamnose reductase
MKILITGANGMLGQDLVPILEKEGFTVIPTDIHNLDITDEVAVKLFLEDSEPDFIIHGAAYTNVDGAETDKQTAFLVNEHGTENLAKYSGMQDIPMLYISTDYVFDGTKTSPYLPSDKTNPINVYGMSKLKGEEALQKYNKRFYITRTSWLYGHKGKNFVETMINLAQKSPELKVVSDQTGCPTWTVELARAAVKIIKNNFPYGIYHVCGSGSTSWHGFAAEIMKLMNIDVNIIPVCTDEFPRPAKRPQNSIMENNNICADWRKSLKQYIKLRTLTGANK